MLSFVRHSLLALRVVAGEDQMPLAQGCVDLLGSCHEPKRL